MLDITSTSPSDWKYLSEGGATLVFSYSGPPDVKWTRKVLRLRKAAVGAPAADDDVNGEDRPDDPTIEFQERVTSRLISPAHLPVLLSVRVSSSWLQELHELHDKYRPEERRSKDRVDATRSKAVLATDLVGGEGISVEIKPKWAFLPSARHLSPDTCAIKTQTCRFCMHTWYRARKESTSEEIVLSTQYCPLDLFSNDPTRVERALNALWDAWITSSGSVNNLRVFVDGKVVKPSRGTFKLSSYDIGELNTILQTLDKLLEALPLSNVNNRADLRDRFTSQVLALLTTTRVLSILCELQRTLDALDIEGLLTLASRCPEMSSLSDPTIDEWSDFVSTYLTQHASMDHAHPSPVRLRYYMMAYLLSATFKDCSIILRLPEGNDDVGSVTVIDLDTKGIDRLEKWGKLDWEIVGSYGGNKRCVPGGL